MAKEYVPFVRKIEVEVESIDILDEIIAEGAISNVTLRLLIKEIIVLDMARVFMTC